jgi:hypothetical protein
MNLRLWPAFRALPVVLATAWLAGCGGDTAGTGPAVDASADAPSSDAADATVDTTLPTEAGQ